MSLLFSGNTTPQIAGRLDFYIMEAGLLKEPPEIRRGIDGFAGAGLSPCSVRVGFSAADHEGASRFEYTEYLGKGSGHIFPEIYGFKSRGHIKDAVFKGDFVSTSLPYQTAFSDEGTVHDHAFHHSLVGNVDAAHFDRVGKAEHFFDVHAASAADVERNGAIPPLIVREAPGVK